ncbi:MAG TPA: hypothetical protein VEV13_01080 [Candidatus Limnocylindria bacterium]|nr:hypothetical protein [Candidatus Limnocylindria bacterium]
MLTTHELKDALATETVAAPTNLDRLAQVHGRVTVGRRQRAAAAGLASIAILAVGLSVVIPLLDPATTATSPNAQPSKSSDVPLPEYRSGGRLVAQVERVGSEGLAVTFSPSTKALSFAVDCHIPGVGPKSAMATIAIDGVSVGRVSCQGDANFSSFSGANLYTPDPAAFGEMPLGEAVQLTLTYPEAGSATSRARIGVYEQVPRADYQFPPAPSPLPTLEPPDGTFIIGSLPLVGISAGPPPAGATSTVVGANGSWSGTVSLVGGLDISAQTVAPGTLRFFVDGAEVWTVQGWDYTNAGYGNSINLDDLGIKSGDLVVLEVRAEGFPGDSWSVIFADSHLP